MPVVERWIYLDHAGVAPLPRSVADAVEASMRSRCLFGRSELEKGHGAISERCREAAGRLIGAPAASVALMQNTAEGINVVAQGLSWRDGDNVVTADVEFPSNVLPWRNLARRGVEVRLVPSRGGLLAAEDVEAAMDARTRVLALSHVEFVSGQVNDLARLGAACRRRGAHFVVDAAQSLGALAVDVGALGIDALCACGWKWLLGPLGTGLLYVAPALLDALAPTFVGPGSVQHGDPLDYTLAPMPGAARFEYSTRDLAAVDGLTAALGLIERAGAAAVEARVQQHARVLRRALTGLGCEVLGGADAVPSGIVSFRAAAWDANALADRLRDEGVLALERCGYVRMSPHFYNTEGEIEEALRAVDRLLSAARRP